MHATNNGAGPTPAGERIVSIDVLRGFALLGILTMNISMFCMLEAVFFNPEAAGPLSGLDAVVWWLGQLLCSYKFMTIFSMLFGAGVVLMYERRDAAGLRSAGLHYRRMAGLLVIGLIHAYALWYGDILVSYAVCGLWVFLLRRRGPILLIVLGLGFLGIGSGISLLSGWSYAYWPAEAQADMSLLFNPPTEVLADETAAYRGGWLAQMSHRVPASIKMHTVTFLFYLLWRVTGLMLLGMGLMKLGVLNGQASRRAYLGLIVSAILLGVPLIVWGLIQYPASARATVSYVFIGSQYNYWGSVLLALGYVGVIMLVCRGGVPRVLGPLAAVGRTALTNYIGQTVICTLLFYGTVHNLGWFGRVSWTAQVGVVVAVWALQVGLSVWWLKRFRMGPLEAAWRWASYGKRPTMLRA